MLKEMGLIFGQELPGPKARVKLMVALGVSTDPTQVRRMFEDDSAGRPPKGPRKNKSTFHERV
jgi:L-asparaginase/Glu-tRNA(Gln) amidotransferase subunit D